MDEVLCGVLNYNHFAIASLVNFAIEIDFMCTRQGDSLRPCPLNARHAYHGALRLSPWLRIRLVCGCGSPAYNSCFWLPNNLIDWVLSEIE